MGEKIITFRVQPTSHKFYVGLKNWKLHHLIVFLLWTFGQAFRSKGQLIGVELTVPKNIWRAHLHYSHRRNPASSSVVTSFLAKLIPACTSDSKGTKAYPLFSSNASNTMNQTMGINPDFVFDYFRAFVITSQAIISWIKYAGRSLISLKWFLFHNFLNICSQCTSQT